VDKSARLDRWYRALSLSPAGPVEATVPPAVMDALKDDLNTPLAISHLHDIAGAIYRETDRHQRQQLQAELAGGGRLLGLLDAEPQAWLRSGAADAGQIEARIAERAQARKERRFTDADRIRADLAAEGVVLEDRPDGTTDWRRA